MQRLLAAVARRACAPPSAPPRRPSARRPPRCRSGCRRAHAVAIGAALEVLAQLVALREELGPVVVGLEGVAVEVVGDVDPAARDSCSPARCRRPPSFFSITTYGMPACSRRIAASRPDMPAPMTTTWKARPALRRHRVPRHVARVAAVERHLLEKHRHVLVRHLVADHEAHHLADRRRRRRRRQRAAAVAIGAQRVERLAAHGRLVRVGQAAVGLARQRTLRPDAAAQDDSRRRSGGRSPSAASRRWHARAPRRERRRLR